MMDSFSKPETSIIYSDPSKKHSKVYTGLSIAEIDSSALNLQNGKLKLFKNSSKQENGNLNPTNSNIFPCDFKKAKTDSENGDPGKKLSLQTIHSNWRAITAENLKLMYSEIFSRRTSKYILNRLEKDVEYYSGDLLKVRVFGKWHDIPRKQVAFGDDGLSYKFSGICLPSKPWEHCPIIFELKNCVESVVGCSFNFVLVNRYKDGSDHMGEHRDDEKELAPQAPIASLSFGAAREFVFRHMDTRGKNSKSNIPKKKIDLYPGSLLLMEYPTNKYWYHSLPVRKNAFGVRVNLTFRKMVI